MTDIFPNSTIEDWRPIVNVKGKALEIFSVLMKTKIGTVIPKADLLHSLTIRADNLAR